MKKILLLLLLAAGYLPPAYAQVSYVISTNPIDSTTTGTQTLYEAVVMRGYVVNTGAVPFRLDWQMITDTADRPEHWLLIGICDNLRCRNALNDSLEIWPTVQRTADIAPGDSTIFELHAGVKTTFPDGLGVFKLKIWDSLQTQVDTVVFRLCKGNCNATGINMPGERQDIAVYPNPVTDKVQVNLKEFKGDLSAVTLQLYDQTGRLLRSQSGLSDRNIIQVSTLPSGIYWLQLRYKGSLIRKEKIWKR